jgi:poly-gamma-glutamate synthesis protein (capsule biosynthesis protein)
MKLPRHHLILLSVIIVLLFINYIIFQAYINKKFSSELTQDVYENGILLNNEDKDKILSISTTSLEVIGATTSKIDTIITKKDVTAVTSILHFGDAMFDRNVRKRMKSGVDPFSSLRMLNIMSDYEIRMLNLEGPIVEMDRSKCQQKAYNFQFASNTAQMLKIEGFTSVTIANNHIYDCYKTGIASTQKYLSEAEIDIIGNVSPEDNFKIINTKDGKKVVLVGIDTTINSYPTETFYTKIKKLKSENDTLLVSMHSGEEYLPRATQKQKDLAHSLIDAGADIVIGHHPHVVENMELYNGGVIFYSLGNFIFDQIGEKENEGMGVGLKVSSENIDVMLFPYNILNSVPTFLPMQEANNWCAKYFSVTPKIGSDGCYASIKRK